MNYSIITAPVRYPNPAVRYLVVEDGFCGLQFLGIFDSESEAISLYDSLTTSSTKGGAKL